MFNNSFVDLALKLGEQVNMSTQISMEDMLKNQLHPKQIVIYNEPTTVIYEVDYNYVTNRNNNRQATKYFVFDNSQTQDCIEENLSEWCMNFNKNNPHREISNIKFDESKVVDNTDFIRLGVNPKQIISFCKKSNLNLCKVNYSYTTNRNNKKEASKLFILTGSINPQLNIKEALLDWVDKNNAQDHKKPLLNVKFLKSSYIGYIKI